MENQKAYEDAKRWVEAKIGFYIHLAIYVVVGTVFITINMTSSVQYFGAKWPLLGWGIGLVFHGIAVFLLRGKSPITDRMIEREMKRN